MSKLTYIAKIGDTSYEVVPQNETVTFVKERDGVTYRHKLEGELSFYNEDYQRFLAYDKSANRNKKIGLTINGNFLKGVITMNGAKFGNGRVKSVDVGVQTNDEFKSVQSILKKKVNLLFGTTKYDVKTYQGDLEIQFCNWVQHDNIVLSSASSYAPQDCINNDTTNWFLKDVFFRDLIKNEDGITYTGITSANWVRINNDGEFSEPRMQISQSESDFDPSDGTYRIVYTIVGGEEGLFPNAILLKDALNKLLVDTPLTLQSNLFNINADGSNPSNTAYSQAAQFLQNVTISQKSDIKRPLAFQKATILETTLEDFLKQLEVLFDVQYAASGDKFILEHSSYFQNGDTVILDLDSYKEATNLEGYSNSSNAPRRESYRFMEAVSLAFEGDDIEYKEDVADQQQETEPNVANETNCDVEFMTINPDQVSDRGMCFNSCEIDGGEYIFILRATKGGTEYINGAMAWNNLIRDYHLYEKHDSDIKHGFDNITAESLRDFRKLEPVSIPFTLEEWQGFEPSAGKVLYNKGLHVVEKASWTTRGILTLNLQRK